MTPTELVSSVVSEVRRAQMAFTHRMACAPDRLEVPTCGGWTGVGEMLGMPVVQVPGILIPRVVGHGEEVYVFGIQSVEGALNTLYLSANAVKPIAG